MNRITASLLAAAAILSNFNMRKTKAMLSKGSRQYKTGVHYPHSSARQRARYARQIAAGQIR